MVYPKTRKVPSGGSSGLMEGDQPIEVLVPGIENESHETQMVPQASRESPDCDEVGTSGQDTDNCGTAEETEVNAADQQAIRGSKDEGYFDIKAIKNHKTKRAGVGSERRIARSFLISWEGYGEEQDSWEPEEHLDGCIETLNAYLAKKNLKETAIKARVGASGKGNFNKKNWVEIGRIMDAIKALMKLDSYRSGLEVSIFKNKLDKTDKLYLLQHRHHCFVILWRSDLNICYIADGSNSIYEEPDTEEEVSSILKTQIKTFKFMSQSAIDHCGSSAVSIARELLRLYRNREFYDKTNWPSQIIAPKKSHQAQVAIFHKYESEKIDDREKKMQKCIFRRCSICGKGFQSNKWTAVRCHERNCFANKANEK